MNVLVRTLPFALVAAFFPAGLAVVLWLLSLPRGRARALVYFAGAATCTIGAGVAILTVVGEAGAVPEQHPAAVAGVRVAVGVLLLGVAVIIASRRPGGTSALPARLRSWPKEPPYGWIFLLGVFMWTPSFAYLAALGFIAGADLKAAARWAQLLLVDAVVLLMVEVPLIVHVLAPDWAERKLERLSRAIAGRARPIGIVTAAAGGLYLIVTGIRDLV
jgi:hypothetical protein